MRPYLQVMLSGSLMFLTACDEPATENTFSAAAFEQARAMAAPAEREWRVYLGDMSSRQHSPLEQVNRSNVHRLQPVWKYDSSDGGGGREIQHNPLVIKGVLYGTSASKRLFALNAATGEELWSFTPRNSSGMVNRGVVYWSGGDDERILYTVGHYLYAVNARNGQAIGSFGEDGRVDLGENLADADVDTGFFAATSPGILYNDLLILGSRVHEVSGAAPGHIRAFDVRTGAVRWRFRTIPAAGTFGADTWPPEALETIGGANAWAGFSLDRARGLVFAATGSAAYDFYGADRAGDNLFANSILALDAATGQRRWHYQVVRHDLWDRDLPAPPNLVRVQREGRQVDAVAQVTKSGHVFVLDRDTGEPLFPLQDVPVSGSALPGETPALTQPLPTLPQPFTRQRIDHNELATRPGANPERLRQQFDQLQHSGPFTLPSVKGSLLMPGFDGGAEWGGAAWDPESGLLYVNANEVASILQMYPSASTGEGEFINPRNAYLMTCAMCHGADRSGFGPAGPNLRAVGERLSFLELFDTIYEGRGRMPGFGDLLGRAGTLLIMYHLYTAPDTPMAPPSTEEVRTAKAFFHLGWQSFMGADGLPGIKPPWGTLNAIDMNTGEIRWRVPLGDYPRAKLMGITGAGAENYGGPVVTAGGLLFIAASPDRQLRAFDKATGELLWQHELPHAGFATPTIYEADGRQFVVIAAGGGKLGQPHGGYYAAFGLDEKNTSDSATRR